MINVNIRPFSREIRQADISVLHDMLRIFRTAMPDHISRAPGFVQSYDPFKDLTLSIVEKSND